MSFLVSLQKIFQTFLLSSFSAYFICCCIGKPFINPKYSKTQIIENAKNMIPSTTIILTETVLFHNYISDSLLQNHQHSTFQTIHFQTIHFLFLIVIQ